jgi:uncharacterized repeat protein (TIGR01451 family)
MKKKQPTLTHYTKRLKKVRLARTITVIATLFVSGVVVAANVLPQVIKSNAATGGSANDVIWGGVDQWNEANAKKQIVDCVYNGNCAGLPEGDKITAGQKASAKALYLKLGVTADAVNSTNTKFSWLLGSAATSPGNVPTKALAPYLNYKSFGRSNNANYTPYPISAEGVTYTFYYKPFVDILSVDGSAADARVPVLEGTSNGIKWIIDLKCGNIIVEKLPSTPVSPKIGFTKKIIRINDKEVGSIDPATLKINKGDKITYRLSGGNTGTGPKTSLRIADALPAGTSWVAQGQPSGFNGVSITLEAKNGPVSFPDGNKGFAWKFGSIPAGSIGDLNYSIKVDTITPQVCNFAYWATSAGGTLEGATEKICINPQVTVEKKALNAPAAPAKLKIGDQVNYEIVMTNASAQAIQNAIAVDILKRDSNGTLTQSFVKLGSAKLTKLSDGSTIAASPIAIDASNQATLVNGNKDAFGYKLNSMPAGSKLTFTITTKAEIFPQACDFAMANYTNSGNPLAIDVTPDICLPVEDLSKPHIIIEKTSPTANRNVARNQVISYSVKVSNKSGKAQTTPFTVKDVADPTGSFKSLKIAGTRSSFNQSVKTTTQTSGDQAIGFTWEIASMPANSWIAFDLQLTVADTAAEGTKICNNATITTDLPNTTDIESTSGVCNTVSLIKQSKTAKYVNRSDDPQKVAANAGDEIEYTLTTTNQASTPAASYTVMEDLTDVLLYADLTDNGGGVQTGSKLIWAPKTIPANGAITNTFRVKVKNPVPNNAPATNDVNGYDYNMFNFYGNDVNIKVNKPLIDRIVDVATNLPETGAAQYGLVIFFLGMSVYFFVRNKQLTSELAAATVEYQHQASAGTMAQTQNLIHPEEADDVTPQPPAAPPAV